MEKEHGSSKNEEPFGEIDWSAHKEKEGNAISAESSLPTDGDVPVEPSLPWLQEGGDYDAASALSDLLDFFLYGRRGPHAVPDAGADRAIPALLYPYRELASIRHDYPICLGETGTTPTLTEIIDGVASSVAEQGEVGERRRRHILQLETEIRHLSDKTPGGRLSTLWNEAEKTLLEQAPSDDKRASLRESIAAARAALKIDGELLACRPDTAHRLYMAVVAGAWERKCAEWRNDLDSLVQRAHNILAADESHSADANNPKHLRESTGGEDMDFDKLSDILKQSHVGEPLPEARRERIQRSLDTIARVMPLFDGTVSLLDASAKLPFDLQPVRNVCNAALDRNDERMRIMAGFFKALRVAELESSNRYREATHDRFFAQFDTTHLSAEELSFCPPVVVVLDREFFAAPDMAGLFELLNSGIPVKVLAELDDLSGGDGASRNPATTPGWPARLAGMVTALNHVHVTQASASLPALLSRGFAAGFDYNGPAFAIVYTGNTETQPGLPLYLGAAAAIESRLFPAFEFDPGKGKTLADRMSVADNPHTDKEWPGDTFSYRSESGEERTVELAFTPADFVVADARFEAHYWRVDPAKWHVGMAPLHEYLQLAPEEMPGRVPYVTAVDSDGVVARVVVTHQVVDLVRRVALSWRNMQESGGVNNSFAVTLIAEEKARLEEAMTLEIEEVEKKYSANLERDLGDLTQEIVQRIASQLLSEGAGAPAAWVAPAAVPAAAPATPAPDATEAVEEEDEEAVTFDDPYIDTPLCTSCNECTKINNKLFEYDDNKQAFIADAGAGTFRDLVTSAEKCPVKIIHPGKPRDASEAGLDDLVKRAEPFN